MRFCQSLFDSRVGDFIDVITVACLDFNLLTDCCVFKTVEISVVMTCNKDCSAITGDKTSGINANTVSERNIIVTEKRFASTLQSLIISSPNRFP